MSDEPKYIFNKYQLAWVKDLKTTKARQCRDAMTDGRGFCCLARAYVANGVRATQGVYEGVVGVLGLPMIKSLNLRGPIGPIDPAVEIAGRKPKEASTLAGLNDTERWTFKQIGSFIQKNPRAVFNDQ